MLAPDIGFGITQHRDHFPAVSDPQGFSVEWCMRAAALRRLSYPQAQTNTPCTPILKPKAPA